MSVLVVMKVSGDTGAFGSRWPSAPMSWSQRCPSKAAGAIHHRFGIGDGFVQVIDEWERRAVPAVLRGPEDAGVRRQPRCGYIQSTRDHDYRRTRVPGRVLTRPAALPGSSARDRDRCWRSTQTGSTGRAEVTRFRVRALTWLS